MDIALFGGTFDPVHEAHVAVARAARDRFDFRCVLMIPAAVPPHKVNRSTAPWEHRYRMVELACESEDRIEPSDLEAGTGRSYTFDTLGRVREQFGPDVRLWFIIGADAFAEIDSWYRWREVLAETEFVVVTRPGHSYRAPEGARIHELSGLNLPVSSSDIRRMLLEGQRPCALAEPVFQYIREHGLYGYRPSASASGL